MGDSRGGKGQRGRCLGLGSHLHMRPILEQRRAKPGAEGCCVLFRPASLGHLAVLWELGLPTCKMRMFPTLVWGELSEIGTCCDFTSNHMILLFAHLQHKVRLLVRKLSNSEIGLDATSPIPASGVLLLH